MKVLIYMVLEATFSCDNADLPFPATARFERDRYKNFIEQAERVFRVYDRDSVISIAFPFHNQRQLEYINKDGTLTDTPSIGEVIWVPTEIDFRRVDNDKRAFEIVFCWTAKECDALLSASCISYFGEGFSHVQSKLSFRKNDFGTPREESSANKINIATV